MRIQFTKMHGLGNDFVVIDAVSQHVNLRASQIEKLANRHTGVGFDQLLLIEPPSRPDADFDYRIFNSDGGEVEHCGNGARCFAKFVTDRELTSKPVITVNTARGLIELELTDLGLVRVNMGQPVLDPNALPYVGPPELDASQTVALDIPFDQKQFGLISMGNPHAVCIVDSVDSIAVEDIGRAVQMLPQFPDSVNVGFVEIVSRTEIRLRVYERGAGETLACGTGACAAVAYARLLEQLDSQVSVATRGGNLQIEWQGIGHDLMMTGPAESVFEGEFRL
ncbi:diaminopimelate epimerase [Litorivicinus sp.]|jgi:diaminopimelate epimerase|nr:diaminopimelate epimerase [Litorivicinus sp.]MBT6288425.1 diaminopimelate epimerase [Oceanospirillales bacterium]MCH1501705.1 diaminopimelate epimerase [Litorivicinaceae bacterium]MDA0893874.1 diaminopimelate epimerase [Pseudomonadota bacterium]HBC49551.1 diaminopimelate epimerase [Gammaproteobacteria bacterium]